MSNCYDHTVLTGAIDALGLSWALLLCIAVFLMWVWVFEKKIKPRMPQHQQQHLQQLHTPNAR
jgi:cbb3-type cytochrome oxidase subunit 3